MNIPDSVCCLVFQRHSQPRPSMVFSCIPDTHRRKATSPTSYEESKCSLSDFMNKCNAIRMPYRNSVSSLSEQRKPFMCRYLFSHCLDHHCRFASFSSQFPVLPVSQWQHEAVSRTVAPKHLPFFSIRSFSHLNLLH